MYNAIRLLALSAFIAAIPVQTSLGIVVTYVGGDAGVGPSGLRPNSNAAAAAFDSAASLLNPLNVITFESAPLGNFASLGIAPGVVATLNGTATDATPGINNVGTVTLGYNTTLGGSQFMKIVPRTTMGNPFASVEFMFSDPIQAYGTYITGLGTANGSLSANFFDGSSQSLPIMGSTTGGVQFFGLTSAGSSISSVTMLLNGPFVSRDIFGLDDVRYVASSAVPEPNSFAIFALGSFGLMHLRSRRNFRHTHPSVFLRKLGI